MCACADAYHLYLMHTHMQKFEYLIKFHWDKEVQPFWPDPFLISSVGGSGYETNHERYTVILHPGS